MAIGPFSLLTKLVADPITAIALEELMARMRETGHPHILGSECDVLHVPETAAAIRRKVDIMLNCAEPAREYAVSGESA